MGLFSYPYRASRYGGASSRTRAAITGMALAVAFATAAPAVAETPVARYPAMAPIAQYRLASQADEVALARSAAPPSIAADAQVLTLGTRGYEIAAPGKNGFVCLVVRSWANNFDNAEFWNPKVRAPHCFNAAAVRSFLPTYLKRTEWVLAGASLNEMTDRTRQALARGEIGAPEPGAMCYMLSKQGYLGDDAGGHWHPHLMFFLPRTDTHSWGANMPGSPIFGDSSGIVPVTVFFAVVANWSDGSPGMEM